MIIECAKIPSFSSYEDRIHPFIEEIAGKVENAKLIKVPDKNIIIQVPGKRNVRPVALTAHLDKIDHFGTSIQPLLPIKRHPTHLEGQLDDSVGLGICLSLMLQSMENDFPPLDIFFSEMEEDFGLGAKKIANYVTQELPLPSLIITIDTTPSFGENEGIALYCNHWELNYLTPSRKLISKTAYLQNYFLKIHPELKVENAMNDYVRYGKFFNENRTIPIPSLAIEPAIHPIHQIGENVFISDIEKVVTILKSFLTTFKPDLMWE
ncbi:MAG: hypothetical protein HWN65_17785 [Candidatus Helarchaeota archaeon]|nr:hypothetical protein [Candidatus Helarchaeota archaeon]